MRQERAEATGPSGIARTKTTKTSPTPTLNVAKLGQTLHGFLTGRVRGYAMQVRKGGQPVYTLIWDRSRAGTDGEKAWSIDTKMHVASVSKLVTAIATVKMLDERGLSSDTKIAPYLPAYWTVGPNAGDITFRKLLTHTAGFTDDHYEGDFLTFKGQIAMGVSPNAGSNYTNGAFSLIRVLGSTLTNAVPRNLGIVRGMGDRAVTVSNPDALWDVATIDAFQTYVKNKVFAPSGVTGVATTATSGSAFAYSNNTDSKGWDSGDLATQLGGAGFRLSVNDVLDVMGTFRRKGTIVSPAKAQEALDAGFGLNAIDTTPAGKMYTKLGWWGGSSEGGVYHVEQSIAIFLPNDMELVMLVNSNILAPYSQPMSLSQTVKDAIFNNID